MADKYGITEHIEFGKRVNTTVWNEQNDEWIVTLDDGEVSRLSGGSHYWLLLPSVCERCLSS